MGLHLTGNESGEVLGKLVADSIRDMMHAMNMKSLKEMGFTREQIVDLAPHVVENHLSSYCPVEITEKTAQELLARVYDSYM